jgi:hypothetical protein
MRIGPDVEIFRGQPEQQVPNAAADEVRSVPALVEPIQNLEGIRVDVAAGDLVLSPRDDGWNHDQRGL